jgi:hypothetical protein
MSPILRSLLFLALFLGISASPLAQKDEVAVGRIRYTIQDGDTLETIFRKFLQDGRSLKKDGEFYRLNRERNAQITDWEDLDEGDELDVYLPVLYIDKKKFKDYVEYKKILANEKRLKKIADSRWSRSLFYMASFGRFNQQEGAIDIKFQQNSPFTLGYATSLKLSPEWRWSASAYLSYLLPADSILSTEQVEIRPEIGLNTYLHKNMGKYSLYGGIDFERFTTFDVATLAQSATVVRDELRIFFATVGIDKFLRNNRQGLLLRASLSAALSTSQQSYEGLPRDRSFGGFKILLYANAPINEKWFIHFLCKQHIMSGAGDLSVNRIGVGFGYKL